MPVTPTNGAVAKLRIMTAATNFPTLDDATLTIALQDYALVDTNAVLPGDTGWVETYDWYGAAETCWGWKEGLASDQVNFNADDRQGSLSDIATHCRERQKYYQALRQTGTITVGST